MRTRIVLNKQDKTIKIVNRNTNIRLTHSGRVGPTGSIGPAGTITIGNTITLDPGLDATVVNTGTLTEAVLDFGIPEGIQGETGPIPLVIQPEEPQERDYLWVDTDDDSSDINYRLDEHIADSDNPHQVTKAQVGLANADNTADLDKPISNATQEALDVKADLVDGKVPTAQIPSLALTKGQAVATRAEMLALTDVQEGDIVSITGTADKGTYILGSGPVSQFTSWLPLTSPTDAVTSVNGQQGTVVLGKADVGLANVDNTTDAAKPISALTQTALDGKATRLNLAQYQVPIRTAAGTGEVNTGFIATENATFNTIVYRNSSNGTFNSVAPLANANVTNKLYVDTADALKADRTLVLQTRANLIANPTARLDLDGWQTRGSTGYAGTLVRMTDGTPIPGVNTYIRHTLDATTGYWRTMRTNVQIVAGKTYTFSGWVRSSSTASGSLIIIWRTGTIETPSPTVSFVANVWQRYSFTYTAPTGTTTAQVEFNINGQPVGTTLDVAGAMLEESTQPLPFFDGASVYANTENVWDGTANTSTSTQRRVAPPVELSDYVLKTGDVSTGPQTTTRLITPYLDSGTNATLITTVLGVNQNFTNTAGFHPATNLSKDLGASSNYWVTTFSRRLTLNASAYLDGSTAGVINVVGNITMPGTTTGIYSGFSSDIMRLFGGSNTADGAGLALGGSTNGSIPNMGLIRVGATEMGRWNTTGFTFGGTLAHTPTHTVTIPSPATGLAYYNTSDQVTNYERARQFWSSGVYNIVTEQGGTGAARAIRIGTFSGTIGVDINSSTPNGIMNIFGTTSVGNSIGLRIGHTTSSTTGISTGISIVPTINGSSTMGYTALLINPTETATGSGAKLLIDAQVGGSSKFRVDNTGKVFAPNVTSTYVSTTEPTNPVAGDLWVVI